MKVVVFGSTGPTGQLIVRKLLETGREVVAFVRDPARLTLEHDRLSLFRGDVYDAASVSGAIDGCDAVVCAVGVPYSFKPVSIYSAAARNIVRAMSEHGATRFVGITSGGTFDGRDPVNPFFFERVLKPIFHRLYDDMREMERIIAASDLDWTILRPPRLLDRPATGNVRVVADTFAIPGGSTVSRADLADVLVRALDDPALSGKAAAVADPPR